MKIIIKKHSDSFIFYNLKTILEFELIFKASTTVILVPVLWGILHFTMTLSGYPYLTAENIRFYFKNPITIAGILVTLFLIALISVFDISAIVYIHDQSRQHRHARLSQAARFATKNTVRLLKRKNFSLLFFVLLLIPFLGIGIVSGFVTTASLPEYFINRLRRNPFHLALYVLGGLTASVFLFRLVYVFHYYTLEGCSFTESVHRSFHLSRSRILRNFFLFFLTQGSFYVIYLFSVLLTSTVILLMDELFSKIFDAKWLVSTSIWLVLTILTAVFAAVAIPAGYSLISILFYHRKKEKNEPIHHVVLSEPAGTEKRQRRMHRLSILMIGLVVTGSLTFGYLMASGALNPRIEYVRTLEVTAHRGASYDYPENTMEAFAGEVQLGADWIELDVHQTKDGVLIVTHDTNLRRVTGKNRYVWDVTYDEIKDLNAAYYFKKADFDTPIPLLADVLSYAKEENIRLNIELKPTGHETDFEQSVVDLILAYDHTDRCVVTSQNYSCLERIKEYEENIETVYVMSMAYGGIARLSCADNFSIRSSFVTNSLVSAVHNNGKQLYAWTVNSRANIQKMIDMNVDNIITDNVTLARKVVDENRTGDLLNNYIRLIRSLF